MDASVMFDRARYAGIFKPVEEAETLPGWCYHDPAYYQAEVKNLFMKVWNFFGHVDQVRKPGDYIALDYVGIPVLIVRGQDNKVRAFANNCRHRGAQLVEGEGNGRAFTCPYHGWVYDLEGKLKGCPGMERTACFERKENGLVELRLETVGCFMFINFDPDAAPLSEYLGEFGETMRSYDLDNLVLTRRHVHEVGCNWKIHIENAMEDYHVPTVHKASISAKQVEHFEVPVRGEWFNMREQHDQHTRALLGEDLPYELPHIKTLQGHAAEGTNFVCLNPSTMLGMTLDCVWYIELQPQGPEHTRVVVGSCFPKESTELPDFEERASRYYKRWDLSIGEDNVIAEIQQRGLRSPIVQPGRLSYLEPLIPRLAQWWVERTIPA